MISRVHLSTILLFAALIWGVLLIIGGVAVSISWLRPLSTVTGIVLLVLIAFDMRLWRLSFLRGWFVKRPDIHGTWRAVLRSDWIDSTGKATDPIEGYLVARQTFSSLSLRLMTRESESELLAAEIICSSDNTFRIAGIYRNEPKISFQDRSRTHYGAILLQILGTPPATLRGHYWTDRGSKGEIELTDHRKKIFYDFQTARQSFDSGVF